MRYLGGKSKIRKEIAQYLESIRKPGQIYFEPFVGGGWILQEMSGERIASDGNEALITMYKALQDGWIPPTFVSEEEYQQIRKINNPKDPMTAFTGFGCSFGGKWFAGYAGAHIEKRDYTKETHNNLMKQLPKIKNVGFRYGLFNDHEPKNMLVYCDPPYEGTTKYGAFNGFDHTLFWDIMRKWSANNTVVISEYNAPEDFKCVLELTSQMGMTTHNERPKRIEKLFIYDPSKKVPIKENKAFFKEPKVRAKKAKLEGCEKCKLYLTCTSPKMKYTGKGKLPILIIDEFPTETDDKKGVQLVGLSVLHLIAVVL